MEEASGVAGAAHGSRHGRTPAGILDGIERRTLPTQLSQTVIGSNQRQLALGAASLAEALGRPA